MCALVTGGQTCALPIWNSVEVGWFIKGTTWKSRMTEKKAEKPDHAETETLYHALPPDIDDAFARFLESACDRNLMLATAESCTGGLLASLLTEVEGTRPAFESVFVVSREKNKSEH